ncbi:GTP cyclohydrolase II [Nocardia sp. alder85J]|uniref:GTP cyclohydrolase II n=1 Tax=Nocardia sp. alder85J TaxID=2862949 RepID=UPI001CD6B74B|nr:GTP cyclohydrolase II [Nocardia sp. alder85J]MCX4092894.1 GTP cyclohydrolase II [Nocardia sp. alder85J]
MDGHPASLLSDDTRHELSRNGATLSLRVAEISGEAGPGHILVFGDPELDGDCLVRIHSRCLYGEMLRSDDCDCGPELDLSLDLISEAGAGVLIYLEQEGRGLGLSAKARGYRYCQQHGVDTFTAYEELGYPADARTYDHAVDSLRALGFSKVRLLTNNPQKVAAVRDGGIAVAVEYLHIPGLSRNARNYLQAKRLRRRHMIPRLRSAVDIVSLVAMIVTVALTATGHGPASMAAAAVAAAATVMRLRDSTHALPMREILAGIPGAAPLARRRAATR